MKEEKVFGGVVLDEIMLMDKDIIWCWQKAMVDHNVVRVAATRMGDVSIIEDRIGKSYFSAIYLDQDIIDAINHAKGLVDEFVRGQGVAASADTVQATDGGGA